MQLTKSLLVVLTLQLVVFLTAVDAAAGTITIQADGNGDAPTIQAGIIAASDGDEVVLLEGVYTGDGNRDITLMGKAITVRSTDPDNPVVVAATILDCQGTSAQPHRGFRIDSAESADSILAGLTVTGGYAPEEAVQPEAGGSSEGGAIFCHDSDPTIVNCVIRDNTAADWGGGIYCHGGAPVIRGCEFHGNHAGVKGGGIYGGAGSTTTIAGCTVSGNSADLGGGGIRILSATGYIANCRISGNETGTGGGILLCVGSNAIIVNCLIVRNEAAETGGGIFDGSKLSTTISNCTILENTAANRGGGLDCQRSGTMTALTNCILRGNTAPAGPQISLFQEAGLTVSYCDVEGGQGDVFLPSGTTVNWGSGNIVDDPLFVHNPDPGPDGNWDGVDDDYGNLNLLSSSPCIDAGDNTAVPADTADLDGDGNTTERTPLDLDGQARFFDMPPSGGTGVADPPNYPEIVDMGAYESSPTAPADFNYDGHVDRNDYGTFEACATGPAIPYDPQSLPEGCWPAPNESSIIPADFDADNDVDQEDFAVFQLCYIGESNPADPNCAD